MNKKDLDKFEKLLLERRAGLMADIGHLRESTANSTQTEAAGDLSTHAYHMADLGTDANEREKSFYLASKSGRFLYHLDQALRRIADGTYGNCEICGKEISHARLEAVPHARFCIACKEKEEQKQAGR
ncbi:MAG TPA: TraR/DksA C4-type zinc finger protein [candidate division Zixibacteria bacterium]